MITDEEIRRLSDHIAAFNRMNDAFQRRDLRAYLWHHPAIGIYEHNTAFLQLRFDVTRQTVQHAFEWLKRWDWQIEYVRWLTYRLTPPADYQRTPPRSGQLSSSERRRRGLGPPRVRRKSLTVEDITALQALGMTLPQIAKRLGVDYSTPYQILRRAKLRRVPSGRG